jgi:hypothetical protein
MFLAQWRWHYFTWLKHENAIIKHENFSHHTHVYVNLVQDQIQQDYVNKMSRTWSYHIVSIHVNIMYRITQLYNQLQSHAVSQSVLPFYGLSTHHFLMDHTLDFMSWTWHHTLKTHVSYNISMVCLACFLIHDFACPISGFHVVSMSCMSSMCDMGCVWAMTCMYWLWHPMNFLCLYYLYKVRTVHRVSPFLASDMVRYCPYHIFGVSEDQWMSYQ